MPDISMENVAGSKKKRKKTKVVLNKTNYNKLHRSATNAREQVADLKSKFEETVKNHEGNEAENNGRTDGTENVTIASRKEVKRSAILDNNEESLSEQSVIVKLSVHEPQFADVAVLRTDDSTTETETAISPITKDANYNLLNIIHESDSIYEELFEEIIESSDAETLNGDNDFTIPERPVKQAPIPRPRTLPIPSPRVRPATPESVVFGPPEGRNCVVKESSVDSLENLKLLNDFVKVETPKMDPKVKRSSSFKNRIKSIFQKDKKPKDDPKKSKKTDNAVFADNAQNENFNRSLPHRHTLNAPVRENLPHTYHYKQQQPQQRPQDFKNLEAQYAQMHINQFQQARLTFENNPVYKPNIGYPNETVIQSNNFTNASNIYVDSSSTNTVESEQSTSNSNPAEQLRQTRLAMRQKLFQDTPPRAQETYQIVERVKSKPVNDVNADRPLPNPYHQEDVRTHTPLSASMSDNSAEVSPRSRPLSPSIEQVKLKLPPNREKVDLQPRLKSPIPPNEVSTDKLIATELLRNKKCDYRDKSPSHQRLEIEIDYPPQEMERPEQSPQQLLEAAVWHKQQRELAQSPSITMTTPNTTNAIIHESPKLSSSGGDRSMTSTPVRMSSPSPSIQRSPPKAEIRNTVEQFCWRELKKLKEKEDIETQMLLMTINNSNNVPIEGTRLQSSICGYAEDPIISHRSRSLAPTQRNTKRSSSLPRDVLRQRRQEEDLYNRAVRLKNLQPGKPIFNRGSLTAQPLPNVPVDNKKVTFNSQNARNPGPWPTKNGFTRSPPTRRIERNATEDEIDASSSREPTGDEIFLANQQRQRELINQKNQAQMSGQQLNVDESPYGTRLQKGNVCDTRNRPNQEVIYGTRNNIKNESPYGTRLNPSNESPYGTRNNPSNESPYGTRNNPSNESPYGTRNNPSNESPYGTRNNPNNESPYGTRNNPSIENHYGTRSNPNNESPYGTRNNPNNDGLYGTKTNPNENPYGTRSIAHGSGGIVRNNSRSLGPYDARNSLPNRPMAESPYGYLNRQTVSTPYTVMNVPISRESPYGTRSIPSNNQPIAESLYGSRPRMNNSPTYFNKEPLYGTRNSPNLPPNQAIYGPANLPSNQVIYGNRRNPNMEPIYGGRNQNIPLENVYGNRQNPRGGPQTIREPAYAYLPMSKPIKQEPLYGQSRINNKPPSGVQFRSKQNIGPPVQARYDYPPNENNGSLSPSKQVTVNNKVCDIYGKIHDSMSSPPTSQRAGVLYGQLQRNANAGPLQYQSYQQLQANNFVRGTRLTASVNDMHRYNGNCNSEPPNRPLPPVPTQSKSKFGFKKKQKGEEEWNSDGKGGRGGLSGSESGIRSDTDGDLRSRIRNNRREDPRRHTLGGDHYGNMSAGQGGPLSRTMDLEGQPRGYPPPSNAMLFDDDPGIMSEVETSSTGFRRGGKQRSSLPVVRTPSKTLERPLGLVFLQYRNETKRALLPNEITSIDTVKALFVRSFPKQLSMEYLDSPQVKIYIHDSSKDMFYELEDLRSHLREIRDRSVLRLFESADVSGGLPMAGIGIAGGVGHFEDPSYFSEPEFDSEYQHQHIHKSKGSAKGAPYYIGSTASLPRAGLLRAYSPAVGTLPQDRMKTLPSGAPPKPQRAYSSGTPRSGDGARAPDRFAHFQRPNNSLYHIPDGYMSSPERGSRYEENYYSQYGTRSGSITPVIDEEVSDTELLDDQYSIYGVKIPGGVGPRPAPRTQFSAPAGGLPYDATRMRVEHMERQLANLTGLVQKALHQGPPTLQVPHRDTYRGNDYDNLNSPTSSHILQDDTYVRSETKTPKLGKTGCHKSVSFEKSVSFSDEPPDMNSPKQHSPQHGADTKPTKPAIKSSTLPRTSSQERDRLKPAPPPKPASLSPGQYDGRHIYRDLQLTPEMYNQLRGLQKKAKDLKSEVRNLRRMSQAQAHSVRETIRDTFIKIRAMLLAGGEQVWQAGMDQERVRLSREEDLYKQEMIRLETDLTDLESTVEELRGNVINRKTRVNMSDVENMALVLSKSSKTVADLKLRFPVLQDSMKVMLGTEMERVVREEKFLKEEPERLESALRRCKKLTGTLVTLKRLASVQEQRLPCSPGTTDGRLSPTEQAPITPTSSQHSKPVAGARVGQIGVGGDGTNTADGHQRPENALDALLDELQTFSKPHTTVTTQIPQVSYTDSEPPTLPVKGITPSHPPTIHEIGRKGSMDSATLLPTQTLTVSTATGSLRRLHSYPSGSDTDNSPPIQPIQRVQVDANKAAGKPPIPERNADLLQHISTKRVPPPPPPRTSSKSPLASPTSPSLPPRSPATNLQHIQNVQNMVETSKSKSQFEAATQNLGLSTLRRNVPNRSSLKDSSKSQTLPRNIGSNLQVQTVVESDNAITASNSSSCESVNSQDGTKKRKEELEQRHQELLKKQKALQEQYARLQQLQRGNNTLTVIPPAPDQLLKKTGSESNILQKMGLQLTTSQMTGSLTNLPLKSNANQQNNNTNTGEETSTSSNSSNTTNKVYETDIL